jgi:hypothetical protein
VNVAEKLDAVFGEALAAIKPTPPEDFLTKFARKAGVTASDTERTDLKEKERLVAHTSAMRARFDGNGEMTAYNKLRAQFQADIESGKTPEPLPDRPGHMARYAASCEMTGEAHRNAMKFLRDAAQPIRQRLADALLLEADRIESARKSEAEELGHTFEFSNLVTKLRGAAEQLQKPASGQRIKDLLPFISFE